MIINADLIDKVVARWKLPYYHTVTAGNANGTYTILFSCPTATGPVPKTVAKVAAFVSGKHLCFRMEHDSAVYDSQTLGQKRLRRLLHDRISRAFIGKKNAIEQAQLETVTVTKFEEPRLQSMRRSEDQSGLARNTHQSPSNQLKQLKQTLGSDIEKGTDISLGRLLVNVFGAADEDNEEILSHEQVQMLLEATLMVPKIGLTKSDIHILLVFVPENENGSIMYRNFIERAPKVIDILRKRRQEFDAEPHFCPSIPWIDVVSIHVGDEIEETSCLWTKQLEHVMLDENMQHVSNILTLPRRFICESLVNSGRFTDWEVLLMMQTIPHPAVSNDITTGNKLRLRSTLSPKEHDVIQKLVLDFRIRVLQNPLVETKPSAVHFHVELKLRELLASDWASEISIWHFKHLILSLDHICLSMFHVHALLMLIQPDSYYFIPIKHVLRLLQTYIPLFFDADAITQIAIEDKQQAEAKQGLGLGLEEEVETNVEADLERALLQSLPQLGPLSVEKCIELCQHLAGHFSPQEIQAFIGHMEIDAKGEVGFAAHIRQTVPRIFEFRKCRYLNELAHAATLPLLDCNDLEEYAVGGSGSKGKLRRIAKMVGALSSTRNDARGKRQVSIDSQMGHM